MSRPSHLARPLGAVAPALALLGACAGGSPETNPGTGGAGATTSSSSSSSSTTSSSSSSSSSTSSSSGGACTPGQTMACYEGPTGTEGIGTCHGGMATCAANGSAFGPCAGQVVPQPDDCQTPEDEDCDGKNAACSMPGAPRWITAKPLTVGESTRIHLAGLAPHPTGLTIVLLGLETDLDLGLGLVHATSAWCDRTLLLVAYDAGGHPVWQLPLHGGVEHPALDVGPEGSIWIAGINYCQSFSLTSNTGAFVATVSSTGVVGTSWATGSFQENTLALSASVANVGLLTEGWGFNAGGVQSSTFGIQLSAFNPGSPPTLTKSVSPTAVYGEHALGRAGKGFAAYSAQGNQHQIQVFDENLASLWFHAFGNARVLGIDTVEPILLLGGEFLGTENFGMGNVTSDSLDGYLAGYHSLTGTTLFVVPVTGPGDQAVVSVAGGAGSFVAGITAEPTTIAGTAVQGGVVLRLDTTGSVAWASSVLAKPGDLRVAVAADGGVVVAGTYRGGAASGYPVPAQEGFAVMTLYP